MILTLYLSLLVKDYVVFPSGSNRTTILLAMASKPKQEDFIGNQAGERVFIFLSTDDFWRDYNDTRLG